MKAVIMAGGLGTRVSSVANDIPKPMIKIAGKPVLQYQIENLRSNNIKDIIIVVGHLGNVIKNYFCDGSSFGVNISYFTEDIPHGTAGALFLMHNLNEDFLLILGDILFDLDFDRFIHFHKEHNALATVVAHSNAHNYDCSVIQTDSVKSKGKTLFPVDTHIISQWLCTNDERKDVFNLVNCGIHIINPELLGLAKKEFVPLRPDNMKFVDLDRNVIKPMVKTKRILAYNTIEYLKDMGTPERISECEYDISVGMVKGRTFSRIRKAVFIEKSCFLDDRQKLFNGIEEVIKKINRSPFIVISISTDECNLKIMRKTDLLIDQLLLEKGAFIDQHYYSSSFKDFPDLSCIEPISYSLNIDLKKSYLITSENSKFDDNLNLKGCSKIKDNSGINQILANLLI